MVSLRWLERILQAVSLHLQSTFSEYLMVEETVRQYHVATWTILFSDEHDVLGLFILLDNTHTLL